MSAEDEKSRERGQNALQRRALQLKRWHELVSKEDEDHQMKDGQRKAKVRFQPSTLFLSSVAQNDFEECERVLRELSISVNTCTSDGLTALHQMAIDDNKEMVTWLLKKGADLNAKDNEGWTPLHAAASCGHVEIVKLLVSRDDCDVFAVNCDQELARDVCDGDECLEVIESAMKRKLKALTGSEVFEREIPETVLEDMRRTEQKRIEDDFRAFLASHPVMSEEVVRTWLEETRDSVSMATVVHVCAAKGYESTLKEILDSLGDHVTNHLDTFLDQDGFTALHAAAFWRQVTCFELLLRAGANFELKTADARALSDLCHENQKMLDLVAESRRTRQLSAARVIGSQTSAETQRKVNARRQRETRRPTQGVTKEEIEMALKMNSEQQVESPPPMPSSPPPIIFTLPQPRDPQMTSVPLETSNHVSTTVSVPLNPPQRRRIKRRSTGVSEMTTPTTDIDDTTSEVSSSVVESILSSPPSTDQRSRSSSRQSSVTSTTDLTTDEEKTTTDRQRRQRETTEEKELDYKTLYKEVSKENEFLIKKVKEFEEKKKEFSEFQREKRQLMRRIGELEEELKSKEDLVKENQRLKEENSALIRVISKLSK